MSKLILNELHKEILISLTKKDFLQRINITEERIQTFIINKKFVNNLHILISNNKIKCSDVLDLSKEIMDSLCPEGPNDWLSYIFQYILNKSFPEAVTINLSSKYEAAVILYLEILRTILINISNEEDFDRFSSFNFLSAEEIEALQNKEEYLTFLDKFKSEYIYELMMIDAEVNGYNTLNHVAAVHYVAMHVARQLRKVGISVNLGLVSGAAAGHDVGKYGCKGLEKKRVAYLHYYYTDQWLMKNQMPSIAHIAANHSTWDLELENLPVESLILIYADFRVKNKETKDGYIMHIYDLKESFDIILNKLDNVDEKKEKRYIRVYSKLRDFENFLIHKGINTDLTSDSIQVPKFVDYAILNGYDVINNIKHMTIEYNTSLMSKLNNETNFSSMIEAARSELDWKNIRAYLNILEEYSIYLSQREKLFSLNFLSESLVHRESDIRKQSAALLGQIIVSYDLEYTKELPQDVTPTHNEEINSIKLWEKYLDMIVLPSYKVTENHKEWIGYSLRVFVENVINSDRNKNKKDYIKVYTKYFRSDIEDKNARFSLLNSLLSIPVQLYETEQLDKIVNFSIESLNIKAEDIRLMSVQFLNYLVQNKEKTDISFEKIIEFIKNISVEDGLCINYLKSNMSANLGLPQELTVLYKTLLTSSRYKTSDLFLDNLKAATPWNVKTISIDYIMEHIRENNDAVLLQTATHLANLVKVSAKLSVRNKAGNSLVQLGELLSADQRNEVAFELIKGIEIDEFQYAKYIPEYIARFVMLLHPQELDEFINDLKNIYKGNNEKASALVIDTFGKIVQHYPNYLERFKEDEEVYNKRLLKILGIILSGLANYNLQVKREAFLVVGQYIFGSKILELEQKHKIFVLIYKKLLTLISEKELNDLFLFNNSSSFNHIYRFISDYEFYNGKLEVKENKNIAFFPGTFDPFSLSHKGIVSSIRDLGYDVYLAVDEFSWSKRVQPRLIRRQIINMSIADELGLYLFPDDIPINISNNNDLNELKSLFPDKDVYIVVGSDVLINASAYKERATKTSIHSFNHLIFNRTKQDATSEKKLEEQKNRVKGKVVELKLPEYLEDISSTQIRENIDNNRDISNLIDSLAQSFIYERNLYIREPLNKSILKSKPFKIEIIEELNKYIIDEIGHYIFMNTNLYENIGEKLNSKSIKLLVIRDTKNYNKLLGFVAFHNISSSEVYSEFKSEHIANSIRGKTSGRIIIIDGIFISSNKTYDNMIQILISEILAYSLRNDYTYALYHNIITSIDSVDVLETLELQGFFRIQDEESEIKVYAVDMKFPICLTLNLESFIKDPLNNNLRVHEAIVNARKRLQKSITDLYKGSLVLSLDNDMINQTLINKICEINGVPNEVQVPRVVGDYACVPFGNILKGMVVPNTITKSIHTEKVYSSDTKKFKIVEYPFYSPIENQIKTIKSFEKQVILVDDLLHKGYRIKELDPLLKKYNINVNKIIVGIMSGRGKDIMDIQGRECDCAYFIPNLRMWFNENLMYPFLGGDGMYINNENMLNLIPSINLILPYYSPMYINNATNESIYNLSMVSLENAKQILFALEKEYQEIFEKKLTVKRLGEVLHSPRLPYIGDNIYYDLNIEASHFMNVSIENLSKLERMIIK